VVRFRRANVFRHSCQPARTPPPPPQKISIRARPRRAQAARSLGEELERDKAGIMMRATVNEAPINTQ
jgi:hypothetical protein